MKNVIPIDIKTTLAWYERAPEYPPFFQHLYDSRNLLIDRFDPEWNDDDFETWKKNATKEWLEETDVDIKIKSSYTFQGFMLGYSHAERKQRIEMGNAPAF